MNWEPLLAAGIILTIAVGVGLAFAAVGLTVAVLWREGWVRFWNHSTDTVRLYFRRLKWCGHTKPSTAVAVAFSLALWFGTAVALTFPAYWRVSAVGLLVLPVLFLTGAWWLGGASVPRHRFRFACSFFEPAMALVVPSLGSKLIDAGLKIAAGL
jgi:hypothetical protein